MLKQLIKVFNKCFYILIIFQISFILPINAQPENYIFLLPSLYTPINDLSLIQLNNFFLTQNIELNHRILNDYSFYKDQIPPIQLPYFSRLSLFNTFSKVPIPPITPFEKPIFVPGEILVKFKYGVTLFQMQNIHSKYGTYEIYTSPYAGFKRVAIPPINSVFEMCKLYNSEPSVLYAEPNYLLFPCIPPTDPLYNVSPQTIYPLITARLPTQWHIPYIKTPEAWDIAITKGKGIVVAVIDSGVAYEDYIDPETLTEFKIAPDFDIVVDPITGAIYPGASFVPGYDFVDFDTHPNDDHGHGTHVASVIAECTNNALLGASIAPNAMIMPIKVFDGNTLAAAQSVTSDAVYWATLNGARIINMSIGGQPPWYTPYPPSFYTTSGTPPPVFNELSFYTLEAAVDAAYANGVVCVGAAGNQNDPLWPTSVIYPAAFDSCIAVSAIYPENFDLNIIPPIQTLAGFSNYGNEVELCAPGVEIWQQTLYSDIPGVFTTFWFIGYEGTSCSAPIVSAVAALMLGINPTLTPPFIRKTLQDTATKLPGLLYPTPEFGYGCVNALAAVIATPPLL